MGMGISILHFTGDYSHFTLASKILNKSIFYSRVPSISLNPHPMSFDYFHLFRRYFFTSLQNISSSTNSNFLLDEVFNVNSAIFGYLWCYAGVADALLCQKRISFPYPVNR